MAEWSFNKRWNPFNSYKLLAHVDRWRNIKRGEDIPAPILVTIDPTNKCNLNCEWCNAKYIRNRNNKSLSKRTMVSIADFLPEWETRGVDAVCIAGGGEPLMNPGTGCLIDHLSDNNIEIGIVTNGTLINDFIEPLSQCTWVGVSIDAGTPETYKRYKGIDKFGQIIDNIRHLIKYSHENGTRLASKRPGYGVSYKYLLYHDNVQEVYEASRIAKESGCKNIHFRPAGTRWDEIGGDHPVKFSSEEIMMFREEVAKAQSLDNERFGVYGITHKFDSQFQRANHFKKCYSVFMTAVFEPPTSNYKDEFTLGLCCDRRGDARLELLRNSNNINEINRVWGSEEHWRIHDEITVGTCPRCTYQPHNEIYENVILNDSMTYKFI